jgi:hypothetical protein
VGEGSDTRVRIAVGPRGEDLVPTPEEEERAAKKAAVAEVKALEAELRRLRGRRPRR